MMTEDMVTEALLRRPTPDEWVSCVTSRFDEFLQDHAANERKASAVAMSLVAHYPDRQALVTAMVDLALEELNHFRQVLRLMQSRNVMLGADEKDPYVNQLRSKARRGPDEYLMDRLLCAAVIEARGEERFTLLAEQLAEPGLRDFYARLARSEKGHHKAFVRLAHEYFDTGDVSARLDDWLDMEAEIVAALPVRPRVH